MRLMDLTFVISLTIITIGFAQNEDVIQRTTAEYQTVIHLDTTQYRVYHDPYAGKETIMGISAGENYLMLWDVYTLYVYDLQNYQLLGKIKPRIGISAAADANGKIYGISGNKLLVYTTYEKPDEEYIINSVFTSLVEFENFKSSSKGGFYPRFPYTVTRIISHNNQIYLVFGNYFFLNLMKDCVFEEDKVGRKYVFPKQILPTRPDILYLRFFLNEDELVSLKPISKNFHSPYSVDFLDKKNQITKNFFISPPSVEKKYNEYRIEYIFKNNNIIYFYFDFFNSNNLYNYKGLLVQYNNNTNMFFEIELPNRNLYDFGQSGYYFTFSKNHLYQIAINIDLSVDVLRLGVESFENK